MSRRRANTGIPTPRRGRLPRVGNVTGCSSCLIWVVVPLALLALTLVACDTTGPLVAGQFTVATRVQM